MLVDNDLTGETVQKWETVPAGSANQVEFQVEERDVSWIFDPTAVTSIRLFADFASAVSFTIDSYSIVTDNPNAAQAVALSCQGEGGGISLRTGRTFIGYDYTVLGTADPSLPVESWSPVGQLAGNGGELEWSVPSSWVAGHPSYFYLPTVAPAAPLPSGDAGADAP